MRNYAGIYLVRNTITGDTYVGLSGCCSGRLADHRRKLVIGRHPIFAMQNLANLYGVTSFEFSVIEYCRPNPDIRSRLDQGRELDRRLRDREWFHMMQIKPTLNPTVPRYDCEGTGPRWNTPWFNYDPERRARIGEKRRRSRAITEANKKL